MHPCLNDNYQEIVELNTASKLPTLEEIRETFGFFDDWEDRYRYVIDLGKNLAPFAPEQRTDQRLVRGCQSQVWLRCGYDANHNQLYIAVDSDAHIVRGLAAILITALSGQSASDIAANNAEALFESLGLLEHLSLSRGNGLRAMIARVCEAAQSVACATPGPIH